jgi:hypothetical protein
MEAGHENSAVQKASSEKMEQVQDRSYNTLAVLTGNEILFENCGNR